MSNFAAYAGIIAGILSLAAYVPYIRSIIKRETSPVRASWIIWTLSTAIIFLSSYSVGVRSTIWLPMAYTIGCATVLLFSLKYGLKGWSRFDVTCLAVVLISIVAWFYFDNPFIALVINVAIDFIGYLPTIRKMIINRREQEDVYAWGLHVLGGSFNLAAISLWMSVEILYPLVIFVTSFVTFAYAMRNRLYVVHS